jgi:hypothetical protein
MVESLNAEDLQLGGFALNANSTSTSHPAFLKTSV